MSNKKFSRTIYLDTKLNINDVISGFEKVQKSLKKEGAIEFGNVDKELDKLRQLSEQIKLIQEKGFSSTDDIKNFEKLGISLNKTIENIQSGLIKTGKDLGKTIGENLTSEATKAQKKLNQTISTSLEKMSSAGFSKDTVDFAKHYLKEQKDISKLEEAITQEIEKQYNIKKEAQERDYNLSRTKKVQSAAISAANKFSLSDLGPSLGKGEFKAGQERYRVSTATGKLSYSKTHGLSSEAELNFQNDLAKILTKVALSGGKAEDVIEELHKEFEQYNIILRGADKYTKNFQEALSGIRGNKDVLTREALFQTNLENLFSGKELERQRVETFFQENKLADSISNAQSAHQQAAAEAANFSGIAIPELEEASHSAKELEENYNDATRKTKELTSAQIKLDDTFDNLQYTVKNVLSIASAFSGLKRIITETFQDVKDLDKAFAEIAMVTDFSVGDMWAQYPTYSKMASELGQNTKDVVAASGLFYQQGLDTAEAMELTVDSMTLATLAGSDYKEATSQITAALRGFKMEMEEGSRVTDVYAELAAKTATDVKGISTAITKTAAIAKSAGMEFETTSAFLAQTIEATQEAPQAIGTAMKTVIARFTELKENIAGTSDSEFDDLDYNKVDIALKSVGISLKDANGQFRDLDGVFLELSSKWNTLDRNSQRYRDETTFTITYQPILLEIIL